MTGQTVPDTGHIVWLQFSPQAGHEQSGRRPALVLSPGVYNNKTGVGVFGRITSRIKGYPFEVQLPDSLFVNFSQSNHIDCEVMLDSAMTWRAHLQRRLHHAGQADPVPARCFAS